MKRSHNTFPYEIKDVELKLNTKLKEFFGNEQDFVRVGEPGYLLRSTYRDQALKIYNFAVRPDDVWLVSFPRSGSTWTQELLWLLCNNMDYVAAKSMQLNDRFPLLDHPMINPSLPPLYETLPATGARFVKTHLPPSLCPWTLRYTGRVVYVARDPRDVAVSLYHFYNLLQYLPEGSTFKQFWDLFKNDLMYWSPYFSHVKEAWKRRNESNFLFIFYEDLSKDLPGMMRRVAKFLGRDYSDEQYETLRLHLAFDNFKQNDAVNWEKKHPGGKNGGYIRKGKVGGWTQHFDQQMKREAEQWIAEHLHNSDLIFPSMKLII